MKVILTYVGNKTKYTRQILENFPTGVIVETYYEPFIGSGAILFAVVEKGLCKNTCINDANPDLINVYTHLKNNPSLLLKKLKYLDSKKDKTNFYNIRDKYKQGLTTCLNAAKFIYFTKLAYRSILYRNGSKFSPGYGRDALVYSKELILEKSKQLQDTKIYCKDIFVFLNDTKFRKNDLIFLDPPYLTNCKENMYSSELPDNLLHNLKTSCDELSRQGVYILLTYSDDESIRMLFKEYNIIKLINSKTNINSKSKFSEILIKNF